MIWKINQLGLLNLKYNKLKQNRPNWNDWGDNEKILIDINEMWVSDIFEMDNEKCNASEMDNRRLNVKRGVVRFIKAQMNPTESNRHWFESLLCPLIKFHFHAHLTQFFNPSKLLYIIKLVELTTLFNFLAIPIII